VWAPDPLKAADTNILKPVGIAEGIYLQRIVENNVQKYAGKINLQ